MKKLLTLLITAAVFAACNANSNFEETEVKPMAQNGKTVVVYFSVTGNTKRVAENLAKVTNADIYEIKPLVPYTEEDLNWRDSNSRSSVEMEDETSRPEMEADNFSVKEYDTVFLGFPIWWGTAPHIVKTFLEKQDFINKTIILFATSGSSKMGNIDKDLKPSVAPSAKIITGKTLNGNPSEEELKTWVRSLK